jgi:hypothetical protein
VGAWHADVWLRTNDAATPRIRIPLTVEIEGTVTVTPGDVALGRVKAGGHAERKVVIRGAVPFKIRQIEGVDDHLHVTGGSDEAKPFHILRVDFQAGPDAGELSRQIRVVTDLPEDGVAEFRVQALVTP